MLRAVQRRFNHAAEAKRNKGVRGTDVRASTQRAIHATWRKICDLEGEDLRDARLVFATSALGLKKPLTSMSKLSSTQLGRILDEMRRHERAPGLPDSSFRVGLLPDKDRSVRSLANTGGSPGIVALADARASDTADIHHLATTAQVQAIDKLFAHLRWGPELIVKFIAKRFNGRRSARLLTPADANKLTNILFNIAAHRRIKNTYVKLNVEIPKISRARIHAEIPALKRELGIDQKPFTTEGHIDG